MEKASGVPKRGFQCVAFVLPLRLVMELQAIAWYIAIGVAMVAGTAVIGALLLIYLPSNYFSRSGFSRSGKGADKYRSPASWDFVIGKNLLGLVLIALGVIMLVLPGQGLLTILIGLMLLSIPGKQHLIAALLRRSGMLESVNRWRAKFGREPLSLPAKR
ncbi:PGPGW domain-containing protein [Anatilimnocola sp. NA78]|uniref:PGPGW domain-containing protein n=1 Tax=Anatilimnocola sp. NA78 TaxID=3415683 RepID=UPI003CE44AF0